MTSTKYIGMDVHKESISSAGIAVWRADPWRLGPPPHLCGRGADQRVRRHRIAYRESPIRLLLGNPALLADHRPM